MSELLTRIDIKTQKISSTANRGGIIARNTIECNVIGIMTKSNLKKVQTS